MYEDFLETILIYIKALNAADAEIAKHMESAGSSDFPGLDVIPVMYSGDRVGRLVDEIGGQWSYVEEPVTQ